MADNKKGPERTSPESAENGSQSGKGSGSAKKPTPLLDLKATEVRGGTEAAAKRETTSERAKFAAPSKPAAQRTPLPSTPPEARTSTSNLKGAPDYKEDAGKPADKTAGAATTAAARAATSAGRTSGGSAATASAGKTGSGSGTASSGGGSGKDKGHGAPPPPPPGKSGGGAFSTFTHLLAGVIGGGIALFAAQPLEEQFGLKLSSAPKVPAEMEQRLAALEKRPAATGGDVKPEQVSALSGEIEKMQTRVADLAKLNNEVQALSKDVDALKAADTKASAGAAGEGTAAQGDGDRAALRARLDKLENALTTLSSATKPDGQPSGVAPLAQFSSKFADLESSLNTQISQLREGLLKQIETRTAQNAEASQQAQAGTQRLDRELASVKTDTARLDQRAETLKVASDKLSQTLRAVKEQAADIKVELDSLKGDVAQQFTKVARPDDVSKAIAPVSEKIAGIEKDLSGVLKSEGDRKANAERIVLSLQLANLKRLLDRGQPYADELADVKKVAGGSIDFSALEAHSGKGVPTARALTHQFQDVAYRIINAGNVGADGSVMDRLLAGAKSIVQVRRTDVSEANSDGAEAAVARIEKSLKQGSLTKALAEVQKLPENEKKAAAAWIGDLEARASVDQAIANVEDQLKASLGAGKAPGKEG